MATNLGILNGPPSNPMLPKKREAFRGSQSDTINSQPIIWHSSNSHQSAFGYALMSPQPERRHMAKCWPAFGIARGRDTTPLRLPHRRAGYLVAPILSDTQEVWITFNRDR